jgi:membrane associated rhomboid family serine protease
VSSYVSAYDRGLLPLKDNVPTRSFPVVTVGLIAANVLVYLWEVAQPGLDRHVAEWGYYPCAAEGPCTNLAAARHHEIVATVFSSMFMHGGLLHIGGNMLFLWIFGNNVEDALGRFRFLAWYLLAGVAATATQTFVTLHFGSAADASIPNVGASGAIAGVLGAYFVLLPRAGVLTAIFLGFFFIFREIPAIFFLGIWIGLQALDGTLSVTTPASGGGVAFFAHIGGFAFGVLTVHLVKQRDPLQPVARYRWR